MCFDKNYISIKLYEGDEILPMCPNPHGKDPSTSFNFYFLKNGVHYIFYTLKIVGQKNAQLLPSNMLTTQLLVKICPTDVG